jgi:hypothetical protein
MPGYGGYGGFQPPKKSNTPSWWAKIKEKLSQITSGGNTPTNRPPYRPLSTIQNQPSTLQTGLPYNQQPPVGYGPSAPTNRPPAWLSASAPTTQPIIPTGSFIGGGGSIVQTSVGPMSTNIPTSSVLGGGGEYVIGPNRGAYLRNQPVGPSSFVGAGGQAVRGPDLAVETIEEPTAGSGGGGGYSYKRRRGGGGGRGYQPVVYPEREQYTPAWARGLANWSIG